MQVFSNADLMLVYKSEMLLKSTCHTMKKCQGLNAAMLLQGGKMRSYCQFQNESHKIFFYFSFFFFV